MYPPSAKSCLGLSASCNDSLIPEIYVRTAKASIVAKSIESTEASQAKQSLWVLAVARLV